MLRYDAGTDSRAMRLLLIAVFSCCLLAACGQKGPLVLPSDDDKSAPAEE